MRIAILSFALGVALVQSSETLPGWSLWLLPGAGFVAVWIVIRSQKKLAVACRRMVLALACLSLGIAWASWRADARLAEALPLALEGRDVEVQGIIASLPAVADHGTRFELDIEKVMTPEAIIPSHVSVTWYVEAARKSGEATRVPELRPGQRWHLTLRLKRPHGTVNPHGFDFEAWALERNIRATGYVRTNGNNESPREHNGEVSKLSRESPLVCLFCGHFKECYE